MMKTRAVFVWTLILLLSSPLFAQARLTAKSKSAPSKHAEPQVTAADIQALRDAIAAQQQQIQQLQQILAKRDQAAQAAQQAAQQAQAAASDAQQKVAAAQASSADKDSVAKLSADLTDVKNTVQNELVDAQDEQKRVSLLEGTLGRFRWTGDMRIRGESFVQQGVADRNRVRVRVRFGFDGKLNEDFYGAMALATGSLGDPTTTNETFTNNFDRKTIGLDRAYITYNPVAHRWLSLTAGKFAYQWQRTAVTGDVDLNPEGFNEKLSFDLHSMPGVQNITFQGLQLLYNEASGTGGIYKGHDSFAVGGQVSAKLSAGPWSATPSFLVENWRYADAILNSSAFAVGATTAGLNGNPTTTPAGGNVGPIPVPGEGPGCSNPAVTGAGGSLPTVPINVPGPNGCVFSPNGMTNSTWVDLSKPNAPVWHFLSNFLYADFILNNQIKTPSQKFPINLILEYENNLNAADHPFDFSARSGCTQDPVTLVVTCTSSRPPVNTNLGKQSHAYLIDASVGQQKNRGDVQFGYAWLRQEQDAVIASFAESDQRAPTNILQHRIYALWKIRQNTVAGFTWWHGRTLNSNLLNAALPSGIKPGLVEPWLNRLQFDLIYTF
jgi:putative porin